MGKVFRVLVIDDEEDLRENLKYLLKMKGYDVEMASDGVEGVKKLDTYNPDLIILDLNMPNMGGIEFYQRICDGDKPRYPVFVLTARANMEMFFKDFNVDGFMAKPFEISNLLDEVTLVLEKKAADKAKETPAISSTIKKVFIVENDEASSSKLGTAFLMKGFTVNLARTGADAMERISRDVPDVACVQMNLADISGDIVISKLKRMAKTAHVKFILFAYGMAEREIVTDTIRHKPGVDKFVIVKSEKDLVSAVESL